MISLANLSRQRAFWLAYAALAALSLAAALKLFPLAVPLLNIQITMGSAEAITQAREIAAKLDLSPPVAQAAARFAQDSDTQSYVELEGGGKDAFTALARGDVYAPYTWDVRLFTPCALEESVVRLRPDGAPVGFQRRVAETYVHDPAKKALSASAARALAEARAKRDWHLDLAPYHLLDQASETRATGRVDHRFDYERDGAYGEATVRLRLSVAGDELVGVVPFMHVPEAFQLRYQALRSANNVIASAAAIAALVLYGIGGCVLGGLWLLRRHAMQWRAALAAGMIVSALLAAATLASAPANWFGADTTESVTTFWTKNLGVALFLLVGGGLALSVVFMVAEGLTRLAFGDHPQLWRLWSVDGGASWQVLGRTLGGYLFVPLELALIAGFYFATNRWLGWWQPSEVLTDPNILGSAMPALTPIANALQAGFLEECAFRAIPLALGALIGARFGHRRAGIVIALLVQALVFGGAHANYPGLPAYSRPLELVVPSLIWGLIFLRYGLLPTILLHALFDLILMSMPLFLTAAPGALAQQALVVLAGATPMIIVLARRAQRGAWTELPSTLRNAAWTARIPRMEPASITGTAVGAGAVAIRAQRALPVLALLGAAAWIASVPWRFDVPGLPVTRAEAIRVADAALAKEGVELGPGWRRMSAVRVAPEAPDAWAWHKFVWRVAGPDVYRTLVTDRFLAPPVWEVRYARFGGDAAERAEEWRVSVNGEGVVRQVRHSLPESRSGASLDRDQARALAERALRDWFAVDPGKLNAVVAEERKLDDRVDWGFEFVDPQLNVGSGAEARYLVALGGDRISATGRYVRIPEAWRRAESARENQEVWLKLVAGGTFLAFIVAALTLGIVAWNRRRCDLRAAAWLLVASGLITCVGLANAWPTTEMGFGTATPYLSQALLAVARSVAGGLLGALVIAVVGGVGTWYARDAPRIALSGRGPAWAQGAAAALFVSGLESLLAHYLPGRLPYWPTMSGASSWSPLLAGVVEGLGVVPSVAIMLFLLYVLSRLTAGWTRRLGFAILIVVALRAAESIALGKGGVVGVSVLAAIADGLLDAAVIYMLLRFDLRTVPGFVATVTLLSGVVRASETNTPMAWASFALAFVTIIALAAVITRYIAMRPPPATAVAPPAPQPATAPSPRTE